RLVARRPGCRIVSAVRLRFARLPRFTRRRRCRIVRAAARFTRVLLRAMAMARVRFARRRFIGGDATVRTIHRIAALRLIRLSRAAVLVAHAGFVRPAGRLGDTETIGRRVRLRLAHFGTVHAHAIAAVTMMLCACGILAAARRLGGIFDLDGTDRAAGGTLDHVLADASRNAAAHAHVVFARRRKVARPAHHVDRAVMIEHDAVDARTYEVALAREVPVFRVVAIVAVAAMLVPVVMVVVPAIPVAVAMVVTVVVAPRTDRRPADVIVAVTPAYPGRRPDASGQPDPSVNRIEKPAPVVIRRPAERLVGNPQPFAVVGPDPVSERVWSPADGAMVRIPDPAELRVVHPAAIRRQRQVEVGYVDIVAGVGFFRDHEVDGRSADERNAEKRREQGGLRETTG